MNQSFIMRALGPTKQELPSGSKGNHRDGTVSEDEYVVKQISEGSLIM